MLGGWMRSMERVSSEGLCAHAQSEPRPPNTGPGSWPSLASAGARVVLAEWDASDDPSADTQCIHRPRSSTIPTVVVDDLVVTAPLRTTLDGVRWASNATEAVVFLDMMLASGLVRTDLIAQAAVEHGGTSTAALTSALRDCHPASRSPQETRFRMLWVHAARLPRPSVNAPLYGPSVCPGTHRRARPRWNSVHPISSFVGSWSRHDAVVRGIGALTAGGSPAGDGSARRVGTVPGLNGPLAPRERSPVEACAQAFAAARPTAALSTDRDVQGGRPRVGQ